MARKKVILSPELKPDENQTPDQAVTSAEAPQPQQPEQTSSSPMNPQPVVPTPTKKSKKGLLVAIIVVLLIAGGAAAAFILLRDKDSSGSSDNQNTKQNNSVARQEVTTNNLQAKLKEYTDALAKQFPDYADIEINTGENNRSIEVFSDAIDHFVSLESQDGWSGDVNFLAEGKRDDVAVYSYLVQRLRADDFSDYKGKVFENADTAKQLLQYENIVCDISDSGNAIYFACADINNLAKEAERIKPFYDAYSNPGAKNDEYILVMSQPATKNDRYPEYETIRGSAGFGGGGGFIIFHRKNQGNWQYSYGGQAPPECSEFKTMDSRKANSKADCYPSKNSSNTVTVGEHFDL